MRWSGIKGRTRTSGEWLNTHGEVGIGFGGGETGVTYNSQINIVDVPDKNYDDIFSPGSNLLIRLGPLELYVGVYPSPGELSIDWAPEHALSVGIGFVIDMFLYQQDIDVSVLDIAFNLLMNGPLLWYANVFGGPILDKMNGLKLEKAIGSYYPHTY